MKSRTASKVLATTVLLWSLAVPIFAATLVNINTSDSATLQTLNGIGPSKAQAIIDYRTQHGSFAKIEDIQNVSGIGPTTYANIKDYITVGDGASTQTSATQTSQTQATTSQSQTAQVQAQASSNAALPPEISAKITTNAQALVGAGTNFDGAAYNSSGDYLTTNVRYVWNFGDGTMAEGRHALHTYHYPGMYSVELSVSYNFSSALARVKLPVVVPQIQLVGEGDSSLTIYNQTGSDIDIGFWTLVDGVAKPFVIPEDTVVLAGEGVRFGASTTGLPGSRDAVLLYPNGTQAATAAVAKTSPLRGERVVAAPVVSGTVKAEVHPVAPATTTSPMAAAAVLATTTSGSPLGSFTVAGLAALIVAGAGVAWHLGKPQAGTKSAADEFDIE